MVTYILTGAVILFIMWIVFANTKKYTGKEYNPVVQALAHLWSFLFVLVDIFWNLTAGSLVFLQWPSMQRFTLTGRLRYILTNGDTGWRYKLALFVCSRLVEPWDQGHCGLK